MKRIINYRLFFYTLIGIMSGIYSFYSLKTNRYYVLFPIIILLSIYLTLSILKKITIKKFLTLLVAMVLGFLSSYLSFLNFNNTIDYTSNCSYTAVVDSIETNSYGVKIILKDCKNNSVSKDFNGKILLNVYGNIEFVLGDTITFYAKLSKVNLISEDKVNDYYYTKDIRYLGSTSINNVVIGENRQTFIQSIRSSIKYLLFKYMSEDVAGISYSALVGDKSFIDENEMEIFSFTGIAHLLAISGLHISIIVYLFKFISDKLKFSRIFKFIFSFTLLISYLFLCDFGISSVRASMMTIVSLFAYLFFKNYDILSSLSFALSVILLISPFSMYSVSFELSMLSVMGIVFLYPIINRCMLKIFTQKAKYIADMLSISLAVQIFTLPVIINTYSKINILSLLLNIFAVPIFTLYYATLFPLVFLSFLLPVFSFLLKIPEILFNVVLYTGELFYIFPTVLNIKFMSLVLSLGLCVACFCLSDYMMVKLKPKILITVSVIILSVIFHSLSIIVIILNRGRNIYFVSNVTNCIVIEDKNFLTLVNIGNNKEFNNLLKFLKLKHYDKIENLVMTNFKESQTQNIVELAKDYNIKNIYFCNNNKVVLSDYLLIKLQNVNILFLENGQNIDLQEVKIEFLDTKNGSGLFVNFIDLNIFLINSGLEDSINFQKNFSEKYSSIDIILVNYYTEKYSENISNSKYYIYSVLYSGKETENCICVNNFNYLKIFEGNTDFIERYF